MGSFRRLFLGLMVCVALLGVSGYVCAEESGASDVQAQMTELRRQSEALQQQQEELQRKLRELEAQASLAEKDEQPEILKQILADQQKVWHDSIVSVLTRDWLAREDAWTAVGTSEELEKIILFGCPEDFQVVYRAYQEAWKTKGELVKKATKGAAIGAFGGGWLLFLSPVWAAVEAAAGAAVGAAVGGAWSDEQKEALVQIEESWQKVVTVATNYGVDVEALYGELQKVEEQR